MGSIKNRRCDYRRKEVANEDAQKRRSVLCVPFEHLPHCRGMCRRKAFKPQFHTVSLLLHITKNPDAKTSGLTGGEDATRTHNALRHTTFPMWLLTIRIPLHGDFDIIPYAAGKIKGYFQFFSFFFLGVHLSSRNRCQES